MFSTTRILRRTAVRHGQYDLKEKHLTPFGCQQAVLTRNRIREMAEPNAAIEDRYGRRKTNLVKSVHSDVRSKILLQLNPANTSIEVDPIRAEGWLSTIGRSRIS